MQQKMNALRGPGFMACGCGLLATLIIIYFFTGQNRPKTFYLIGIINFSIWLQISYIMSRILYESE